VVQIARLIHLFRDTCTEQSVVVKSVSSPAVEGCFWYSWHFRYPEPHVLMGASPGALKEDSVGLAVAGATKIAARDVGLLGARGPVMGIVLYVRCEQLKRACPTFVAIYSKDPEETNWTDVGRTEICDNGTAYPSYDRGINVEFQVESQRLLRLEVYRVRDCGCVQDLSQQSFLGGVDVRLVDAILARKDEESKGWLTAELLNPLRDMPFQSNVCVYAEEDTNSKSFVSWEFCAKVRASSIWKRKPDAYCVVYRTSEEFNGSLNYFPVFTTRVARRNKMPRWERIEMSVQKLCQNRGDAKLVVEVYDWFRSQEDQLIGECAMTYNDLFKAFKGSKPLLLTLSQRKGKVSHVNDLMVRRRSTGGMQRGAGRCSEVSAVSADRAIEDMPEQGPGNTKVMGQLSLQMVGVERRYSFLDFIRGGLQLRLIVAIDFSRSNAGPQDLHRLSPHERGGKDAEANELSDYAVAVSAVAEALEVYYGGEAQFPGYGFGAKIPPSCTVRSDCFSLTGDFFMPELSGAEAVVDAYRRAARIVRFHGPSNLREVVEISDMWARPFKDVHSPNDNGVDMRYFVLLILTDGDIADQTETVEAIVRASDLPLSIAVCGIGKSDFGFLAGLDDEVRAVQKISFPEIPERGMAHFARFNKYRHTPNALAGELLSAVPKSVVEYYGQKGLKPWNLSKFEDENGVPLQRVIPPPPADSRTRTSSKVSRQSCMTRPSKDVLSTRSKSMSKDTLLSRRSRDSSRTCSKTESQKPSKELSPLELAQRKQRAILAAMPQFLKDMHQQMLEQASALGYEQHQVTVALKEGIPTASMEVMIDTILYGGYGKQLCFRDAAEAVFPKARTLSHELQAIPEGERHSRSASRISVRSRLSNSGSVGGGEVQNARWDNTPCRSVVGSKDSADIGSKDVATPSLIGPTSMGSRNANKYADAPRLPGTMGTVTPARRASRMPAGTCSICLEMLVDTELTPCTHRVSCHLCSVKLGAVCPLCRAPIESIKRLAAVL